MEGGGAITRFDVFNSDSEILPVGWPTFLMLAVIFNVSCYSSLLLTPSALSSLSPPPPLPPLPRLGIVKA